MKYTPDKQSSESTIEELRAQRYALEKQIQEVSEQYVFQLTQGFITELTHILQKENIQEASYVGYLETILHFQHLGYSLSPGHYFDIKAPGIPYAISVSEFKDKNKLANYTHRVEQNYYPALEAINRLAQKYNAEYQIEVFNLALSQAPGNPFNAYSQKAFTQNLEGNMRIMLSSPEVEMWKVLRERHDLQNNLPPSTAVNKPHIKI